MLDHHIFPAASCRQLSRLLGFEIHEKQTQCGNVMKQQKSERIYKDDCEKQRGYVTLSSCFCIFNNTQSRKPLVA